MSLFQKNSGPRHNKPKLLQDFVWIANKTALNHLIERLRTQTVIAIDTESDSLYSYFEKVCLVQVSICPENEVQDYVIDPLLIDITPLGDIFAAPQIQKVFHAAEYDVMTLRRDYGFHFNNLFDTMIAARLLEWSKCGLGDILATHFQIKLDKRFQQHDWGQRPLSPKALQYARLDTHYLLELRHLQAQALQEQGQSEAAQAAFDQVSRAKMDLKIFRASNFRRIKQARRLSRQQQSILQKLYIYRDEIARWSDRPTFKVISDFALYQIVLNHPKSRQQLKRVKGLNQQIFLEHGDHILTLLQ